VVGATKWMGNSENFENDALFVDRLDVLDSLIRSSRQKPGCTSCSIGCDGAESAGVLIVKLKGKAGLFQVHVWMWRTFAVISD